MKTHKKLLSNLTKKDAESHLVKLSEKFEISQSEFLIRGKKRFYIWITYTAWRKYYEGSGCEFG